MIGEKGMSSDRNGGAFMTGDVLLRQQGYTGFGRESLETHMKGSIWVGSSDSFHEAPRKLECLYSGMQVDTHFLCE